jgi:hypothetical protein
MFHALICFFDDHVACPITTGGIADFIMPFVFSFVMAIAQNKSFLFCISKKQVVGNLPKN